MNFESGKVMIVDDLPANLKLLKEILQRIGYEVFVFRSAVDAIGSLERQQPDIILMDITMPEMNGYEACRAIKADSRFADIPLIFISALNAVEDKVKAFENGGVDYITKPFEFEEVRARIATHLHISRLQKEIGELNRSLERRVAAQTEEIISTNHKLLAAQNATIIALAKLSECRDEDTGLHLDRVGHFCAILAAALVGKKGFEAVNGAFITLIKMVAPLHDIGKVGIPDRILLKPARLDPDEFEIMKTHTTLGAQTFLEVKKAMEDTAYCDMAYEVIAGHHEKFDGTGYPLSLKGDAIPCAAQIMALADVYDALRSRRPYKEPLSAEAAARIILEGRGTHFAPILVDAFMESRDEFDAVFARLADA